MIPKINYLGIVHLIINFQSFYYRIQFPINFFYNIYNEKQSKIISMKEYNHKQVKVGQLVLVKL